MWLLVIEYKNRKKRVRKFRYQEDAYKELAKMKEDGLIDYDKNCFRIL